MRKIELEPTKKNLIDTLQKDAVDRNKELIDFIQILDNIDGSFNISIDGGWGSGKTFFVKQCLLLLDFYHEKSSGGNTDVFDGRINDIPSKLIDLSLSSTFSTVYYDAWLYDDHTDPLISLIYVIINSLKKADLSLIKDPNRISRAGKLVEALVSFFGISIDINGIMERSKTCIDKIVDLEEVKKSLNLIFDEIIVENSNKLIVVIDELDRCNPNYAVSILERIKHFIDDYRVIFVFSTNKQQLVHTIKKHYGVEFNATQYLNRFFDFQFTLNTINSENYLNYINPERESRNYFEILIVELGSFYGFTMRDFNILYQKVGILRKKHTFAYLDGYNLSVMLFGLVACALEIIDSEMQKRFISGELENEVIRLYTNVDVYKKIVQRFLCGTEVIDCSSDLVGFYKFVFGHDTQHDFKTNKIEFWYTQREELMEMIRK